MEKTKFTLFLKKAIPKYGDFAKSKNEGLFSNNFAKQLILFIAILFLPTLIFAQSPPVIDFDVDTNSAFENDTLKIHRCGDAGDIFNVDNWADFDTKVALSENITYNSDGGSGTDNFITTLDYPQTFNYVDPVTGFGTITFSVTATNANGLSTVETYTLVIKDWKKPEFTDASLNSVELDADVNCEASTILTVPTVTDGDECSNVNDLVIEYSLDDGATYKAIGSAETFSGSTTVTWKVTDEAGNYETTTQTVNVNDVTNPTITNITDITGKECGDEVILGPDILDNCSLRALSYTVTPPGGTAGSSVDVKIDTTQTSDTNISDTISLDDGAGVYTITWTLTDKAGNNLAVATTQTITVDDNTAPEITSISTQTVNTDSICNATATLTPDISDNCRLGTLSYTITNPLGTVGTIGTIGTYNDSTSVTNISDIVNLNDGVGVYTITWTLTDKIGNNLAVATTQTITVADNTAPEITSIDADTVYTDDASCNATATLIPDISDNCSLGTLSYTITNPAETVGASVTIGTYNGQTSETISEAINLTDGIGEYIITWSLTDEAGNSLTTTPTTQIITVEDNVKPNLTVGIDGNTVFPQGDPNYDGGFDETYLLDFNNLPADATFDASNFSLSLNIGSTDASAIDIYLISPNGDEAVIVEGATEIGFGATFNENNTITWSGTETYPSDYGVAEIADGGTYAMSFIDDLDAINLKGTWKLNIINTDVDAFTLQNISLTFNNETTTTQGGVSTFETLFTDDDCLIDVDFKPEVSDNCELTSLTYKLDDATASADVKSQATVTIQNLTTGIHTIEWTAIDVSNNDSIFTTVINIADPIDPTITADNKTVYTEEDGGADCDIETTASPATYTDNCTVDTIMYATSIEDTPNWVNATFTGVSDVSDPKTDTLTLSGHNDFLKIKWRIIDAYNNTAEADQTVTLEDDTDPIFTADVDTLGDDIYYICADGDLATVEFSIDTTYFDDNCTLKDSIKVSYFYTKNSTFKSDTIVSDSSGYGLFSQDTLGVGSYEVTWILEDEAGNTNTDTTSFVVEKIEVEDLALDFTDVSFIVGDEERFLAQNTGDVIDGDGDSTIHTWNDDENPLTSPADMTMHLVSLEDACQAQNTAVYPIIDNALQANLPVIVQKSELPNIVPIDLTCLSVKTNIQVPAYVFEVGRDSVIYYVVNNTSSDLFPANSMYDSILQVWTEDIYDPNITNNNSDIERTIQDGDDCKMSVTWGEVSAIDGNLCGATLKSYAKQTDTVPPLNTKDTIKNFESTVIVDNDVTTWSLVNNGDEFEKGVWTIVYIATDESPEENKSGTAFKLTVFDGVNPEITNIDAQTVPTDASCNASVTLEPDVSDNCELDTLSYTITPPSGSENNAVGVNITSDISEIITLSDGVGDYIITWTLKDAETELDNTITETQIITVEDNLDPEITSINAQEVFTNENCEAKAILEPDVEDNCELEILTYRVIAPDNSLHIASTDINLNGENEEDDITVNIDLTAGTGDYKVEWTLTDDVGNEITEDQTITVTDDDSPEITNINAETVYTNANDCNSSVDVNPNISDNCELGTLSYTVTNPDASVVTLVNVGTYNTNSETNIPITISLTNGVGNYTITWTLTDKANNNLENVTTQIITVEDNISPEITNIDAQTVFINVNDCNSNVTVTPDVSDNCELNKLSYSVENPDGNNGESGDVGTYTNQTLVEDISKEISLTNGVGNYTITWTLTDNAATPNTKVETQIITVEDNIAPTITAGELIIRTGVDAVNCSITQTYSPDTSDDNCEVAKVEYAMSDDDVFYSNSTLVDDENDPVSADITFEGVGVYYIKWTITDASGLSAEAVQKITLEDNTIPKITDENLLNIEGTYYTCSSETGYTLFDIEFNQNNVTDNCSANMILNYTLHNSDATIVEDELGNDITFTGSAGENITFNEEVDPGVDYYIVWTATDNENNSYAYTTDNFTIEVVGVNISLDFDKDTDALGFVMGTETFTLDNDGFTETHEWTGFVADDNNWTDGPTTLYSGSTIRLELLNAENCATQQISAFDNLDNIIVDNSTISCPIVITTSHSIPFTLGVGRDSITFYARAGDENGEVLAEKTLQVWVEDTHNPLITLTGYALNASNDNAFDEPIIETIITSGECGKPVNWLTPSVTDNCGGYDLVCQYKDSASINIDWENDLNNNTDWWKSQASMDNAFDLDDNDLTYDGWITIAPMDSFPLGIGYVRYVARDHSAEKNVSAKLLKVIVNKSTPPLFTRLGDDMEEQAVENCTKNLDILIPEVDGGCSTDMLLTYYKVENEFNNGETVDWVLVENGGNDLTTNYTFHYGENTITWKAIYDEINPMYNWIIPNANLPTEATQIIEIIDTEAPTLDIANMEFDNDTGDNGEFVMDFEECYSEITFDLSETILKDNCSIVNVEHNLNDLISEGTVEVTGNDNYDDGVIYTAKIPVGTHTINWTITDEHDNVLEISQEIEVIDTQFPYVILDGFTNPEDLAVNEDCQKEVTFAYPDVYDNCPNPEITYNVPNLENVYTISNISDDGANLTFNVEFLNDGVANVDVNWTITDVNGNVTNETQTLEFIDNTNPLLIYSDENYVNTASEECNINFDLKTTISDNCKLGTLTYNIVRNGNTLISNTDIGTYNSDNFVEDIITNIAFTDVEFDDNGTATYNVNWTLTDKFGNQITDIQEITLEDTQAPTITSDLETLEFFTNTDGGDDCSVAISFTEPTATDCTPNHVTVKEYKLESNDTYEVFTYGQELEVGIYDVRYTFTDAQNNSSEKEFIIEVIDDTVPVVTNDLAMNTTVEIDKTAENYDDENYNCEISVTLSPELSDNCNLGVLAYNIFKNESGNWNEKPELANAQVGFYDGNTTATVTDLNVDLGSYGAGEYRIVWILKDYPAENVANYTTIITVLDITKPIFNENTLVDVNIEINGEICERTFNLQTPEFKDNCTNASVKSISIVNNRLEYADYDFDVSNLSTASQGNGSVNMPLGKNTIAWEISDENGNTETATQIVNLIDNRIPTITCNNDLDLTADVGSCTKDIEIAISAIWDNCPQTMELSVSFIDEKGLNGVAGETFTYVYDNNGNLNPNLSNFNPVTFTFPVNTSIDNATVLTWTLNDIITDGTHTVICEQEVNVNASPVAPFVLETPFVNEMTQIGDIVSDIDFEANYPLADEDNINNYALNIVQGFGDYTTFSIDPLNDKILTSEATFNSENKSFYVIKVRAINCEDEDDAVTFDFFIYVNDENDAPQLEAYVFNIDENTQNGIEVGEIEATDEDVTNQTLTYSIVNGNTDNAFALTPVVDNKTTIIVNNINALDFEINEYFNLEIEVSDGLISSTGSVVININDINEALTNAELVGATIQENIAIGENVLNADASDNLTISVNDPDNSPEFTNYTYEITNGNIGNAFTINTNGELIINSDIDFETLDIYTLDIKVIDGLFNYTINDVVINIVNVNEAPIATNQTFSNVTEDTFIEAILANPTFVNDVDADDNLTNLMFVEVSDLEGLSLLYDGIFGYINPTENFTGTVSFTYKVIDDEGLESEEATVTIIVNPVNDAPVSVSDNYEIEEDETLTSEPSILSNDYDVDNTNDELSVMLISSTTNGNLTLNSDDGTFTYKANDNFNGEDSFTYLTYDGVAYSQMATVTITVIPMPDAPIAINDNYTTNEETLIICNVLLNDTDIDNENNDNTNLTISTFTEGANGSVINFNNELYYTPSINFNGTDEFTYVVIDSDGLTSSATVTVVVNPVNDAPVVTALNLETNEDINLNETFIANDVDNEFSDLTFEVIVSPTNGVLNLNENGSFTYAPNSNYYGDDYFTYLANDGELNSNVETVSITINPINDAPIANAQTFTIDEDNNLNETITSISDVDDNNDILEFEIISDNGFDIALNSDGSFIYTTVENFNGNVTFTYKVKDDGTEGAPAGLSELYSNDATITIIVNPVNDKPIAYDDNDIYTTTEETEFISNISILNNDTDIDGDNLSTVLMSSTIHGILNLNTADGSFTYTPMTDFVGDDNFTYKVFDGTDYSEETGTVTITITNTNDAPIANNDTYVIEEGEMLQSVDVNVMNNDIDIDSDNLTTSLVDSVSNGALLFNEDGSFTYVANLDFNGTDEFTYEITDGELTDQAVVKITSTPVNDIPQITYNLEFTSTEDSEILEGEITGVSDSDNDVLTFVLLNGITTEEGTLILNATEGTFAYVPTENFNGNVNFTYKVYDGQEYSVEGNVNINVSSVNDIPISNDQEFNFEEGQEVIGVITDVYDVEDNDLTFILGNGINDNLILEDNGSFTYNTDENFNGELTFTYKVKDSENTESEASTVTIIVTPVNDAPVIISQNFEMDEDGELNSTLLDSESITDIDNDINNLTFELVGNLEGLILNSNDGSFTYNPEENFNGEITFAYKVNDGQTLSNEANVLITINPVNDAPTANNDTYVMLEDANLQLYVLENDLDIDGDNLIIVSNTNPANGNVLLSENLLIYTPVVNWNGTDEFTYEVSDGTTTSQATVTVNVNPVNDTPEVSNQEFDTSEDIAQFYSIITNVNDDDNDQLHFSVENGIEEEEGTLNLSDNGSFIYIPAQDFNGVVNFSYYVNDGTLDSDNVATITINVSAVNDAPLANAQTFIANEDIEFNGTITNILDVENDNLTFSQVGNLERLTFSDDGTFNYIPNENFNGEITFAYKVNDGEFDSEEATITIIVTPVNDNPVANNQEFNTDEDTPLTAVISNVSDIDNMNLSFELMSELEGLSLASNGLFNYTPIENSNETVTFVYQVSDGELLSEQKIVTININPINDEPVANDDIYDVLENEILDDGLSVLNNDTDVENSDLSVTLITPVSNGILSLEEDGTFTYTPNPDYFGSDNFTYEINDGELTNQASVTINVIAVNNVSVANADNYIMDENTQMVVSANDGILYNDTDEDTDNVLTAVLSEDVTNGILILNPNGSFIYTPTSQYFGNDVFTYYVNDGTDNSNTTTVTITINEVNFVPIATNDTYNTYEDDGNLIVNVDNGILNNDNDADTDNTLTAHMVDDSNLNGTINLSADGSFIYTPSVNFNGLATFTYQAYDGHDYSEIATVNITVTSVNDAPIAVADDFTIDEDNVLIVNFNGVLENDIDNDGNNLTAFLVSTVSNGDLMFNSDGSFTYIPNENFNGADNFTYKAYDGTDNSENVVVNINVNPVNDNPVAVEDNGYQINEDLSLDISVALGVLNNDTDIDSENLIAVLLEGTSNGNLILNNDGSFTYSPNENFNGEDYFTYNAQDDDEANSNVVTVYINVINVNDAPVIENQTFDGLEDVTLSASLLNEFITDIDNDINELTFELVTEVTEIDGLTLNSDGSFTYLNIAENFNGVVSFTYRVFDGIDYSNVASVDIEIAAVNDAPIAENQEFDAVEDIVLTETITNVSDVDEDNLTFELLEGEGIVIQLNGSFTYTPVANFNGNISFTYQVNDGELTAQANINIYVESVNDAPTFDDIFEFDLDENSADETFIGNIFANDVDNDILTYSFVGENNVFEIDEFTGDIKVINSIALDYEELIESAQPIADLDVNFDDNEQTEPYFELTVKAEDNEGEVVETIVKIYVIDVFETFDAEQVNNAFAPGSGNVDNEYWMVLNVYDYIDCQLRIYNQWQQVVFTMDGYNNSWNGTNIDGDELPAGTYYYIFDCGDESHTGYVTIIR